MILIGRNHLREISDAAEAAYPAECCGLLIGVLRPNGDVEVTRVAPSRNLCKAPSRFEIDPQLWIDVTRAHPGQPTRVMGLYHSHPDASAQPTAIDLEAAWGEDLVWLIVAVVGDGKPPGQAIHVTAHIRDNGGRPCRPVDVRTTDWGPSPVRDVPPNARSETP